MKRRIKQTNNKRWRIKQKNNERCEELSQANNTNLCDYKRRKMPQEGTLYLEMNNPC
jgi:hypothetical protein